MYVVKQPCKTIISFVRVTKEEEPLEKEVYDFLAKLSEKTDIIFIFNKESQKVVDCKKFTSLYSGCGYVVEDNIIDTIIRSFQYATNIFNVHLTYLLLDDLQVLPKNSDTFFHNLEQFNMSNAKSVICQINKLDSERLFELYRTKPGEVVQNPKWKQICFGVEPVSVKFDDYDLHTKYEVVSNSILLKVGHVQQLLGLIQEENWFKDYVKTFKRADHWNLFFGSYFFRTDTKHLEGGVEDFKIGKLS